MLSFFTTSFAIFTRPALPLRALSIRARASHRRTSAAARGWQLGLGLLGVGIGIGFVIQAGLGVASWDVLNVALAQRSGAPLGAVALMVGLAAGALAVVCGARPTWRSMVPVVVVAPLLEVTVRTVGTPASLVGQFALLLSGMVLVATGVGAYIGSENGAGPADLLFLQLAGTRLPIWAAKAVLDGSVVTLGWSLGGPVGIGTVIVTAGMGPLVALSMSWFDLADARANAGARAPALV